MIRRAKISEIPKILVIDQACATYRAYSKFQKQKSTTSTQGYEVCFRKNIFYFEASPPDVMGRPRGIKPSMRDLNRL